MPKSPFKSMEDVVARFGGFEPGLGVKVFPLADASGASDWSACKTQEKREAWGKEWRTRRALVQESRPIEPRDFVAILAYETEGAKMEGKLGWPSLGLWYEALMEGGGKSLALTRQEIADKLIDLIESGASVAAFQALYPEALAHMLTKLNPDGSKPVWSAAEVLLKGGWSPNQWSPTIKSGDGCSSMQGVIWDCSSLGGAKGNREEIAAGWASLLRVAMKAGFDLEARSMSGLTALGGCLKTRGYYLGPTESDPRVNALFAVGADPTRASSFWLCNFENDEVARQTMLGRLESGQIAGFSEPGLPGAKRKPAL